MINFSTKSKLALITFIIIIIIYSLFSISKYKKEPKKQGYILMRGYASVIFWIYILIYLIIDLHIRPRR